jgi:hypothetical protein
MCAACSRYAAHIVVHLVRGHFVIERMVPAVTGRAFGFVYFFMSVHLLSGRCSSMVDGIGNR